MLEPVSRPKVLDLPELLLEVQGVELPLFGLAFDLAEFLGEAAPACLVVDQVQTAEVDLVVQPVELPEGRAQPLEPVAREDVLELSAWG